MKHIDTDSMVDLIFQLKWKSDHVTHTDCLQANKVNMWRDILPPPLHESLMGRKSGDIIALAFSRGEAVPEFQKRQLYEVKLNKLNKAFSEHSVIRPQTGRFYPKGLLKGLAGIFKDNVVPFRCVGSNNGQVTVDFNHPLAGKDLSLSTIVGEIERKPVERGGTSIAWMETLTDGPGMQARWQNQPTDFFSTETFQRDDETSDARFYGKPRYVQHIDDTAIELVKNTYGRFLKDGMEVLDLMSSWQSHLPDNLHLKRLVGLGLNQSELKRNSRLSGSIIQDLNINPRLPFEPHSFDAVICTVSAEYLIDPQTIFKEVSRILRSDGYFIVTFSNRWFPTKAVKIWKELHEFERMGIILEYFIWAGNFKNLQTYSFRGLPRPHNDKYFPEMAYSDPVYAVWGQKRQP